MVQLTKDALIVDLSTAEGRALAALVIQAAAQIISLTDPQHQALSAMHDVVTRRIPHTDMKIEKAA